VKVEIIPLNQGLEAPLKKTYQVGVERDNTFEMGVHVDLPAGEYEVAVTNPADGSSVSTLLTIAAAGAANPTLEETGTADGTSALETPASTAGSESARPYCRDTGCNNRSRNNDRRPTGYRYRPPGMAHFPLGGNRSLYRRVCGRSGLGTGTISPEKRLGVQAPSINRIPLFFPTVNNITPGIPPLRNDSSPDPLSGFGWHLRPALQGTRGKTPLQAAATPNLDKIAGSGICGIMDTIAPGIRPGSDTAHLALLGYPPDRYYTGRGPLEAEGCGIHMEPGMIGSAPISRHWTNPAGSLTDGPGESIIRRA
jgi:hypothetical protein